MILVKDDFIRGNVMLEGFVSLKLFFKKMGEMGMDVILLLKYLYIECINYVYIFGNFFGIVDGVSVVFIGSE